MFLSVSCGVVSGMSGGADSAASGSAGGSGESILLTFDHHEQNQIERVAQMQAFHSRYCTVLSSTRTCLSFSVILKLVFLSIYC